MSVQHKSIYECQAFSQLQCLAEMPLDLSLPGVLNPERVGSYVCKGDSFDLLYGCQRVTETVLDGLQSLADECAVVKQFQEMRQGQVLNRIEGYSSENRQVLHCASRDLFSATPANSSASAQAKGELAKLREFLSALDAGTICNADGDPFDTLVQIGIGGSDLGPRSIYEALKAFRLDGRQAYFISNVDPDDAADVLARIALKRCLILVVSKS